MSYFSVVASALLGAVLLALGVDRNEAGTILKQCDGNLRRVFSELARERDGAFRPAAPRKQGGTVGP